MAIQILVMTDNPSAIQGVIHSLEDRRARVLVHPLDISLLIVAREASPAAILLDVSDHPARAQGVHEAIQHDEGFSSVPVFALGGALPDVTSYYEDLSGSSSVAAEILAIAELSFGLQDGDDAGLFENLDQEMDLAAVLGPATSAPKPPAAPPRSAPPGLPPLPGVRRESVPGVPMPARSAAMAASTPPPVAASSGASDPAPRRPRATGALPTMESSGRETLNLKQELLTKDREILELRSRVMELEESRLQKDEHYIQALERIAALDGQIADFEDQLEERQVENDRLAKALDELTRTHEAELASAHATMAELQDANREWSERADLLTAQLASNAEEAEAALVAANELLAARLAEENARANAELAAALQAVEEEAAAERAAAQERFDAALAEAANQAELQEQIAALEEANASLTAECAALSEQRDEVLAITAELESAMNEADAQAAQFADRFEKADRFVEVLRKDLGVYVEAAHRVQEERAAQSVLLASLAEQLASVLEATRNAAMSPNEVLPATNWEAAYNAYLSSSESDSVSHDDDADVMDYVDEDEEMTADVLES